MNRIYRLTLGMALGAACCLATPAMAEQVFFEGFEEWDGTLSWLPQGWSRISATPNATEDDGWQGYEPTDVYGVDAPEGDRYFRVTFSKTYKDEWLVTPSFTVPENSSLFFIGYINGLFMFNMDNDHYQSGAMDFIKRDPSAVLQIWAIPAEGDKVLLKDYYEDDFKNLSFTQLLLDQRDEFKQREISLSSLEGQEVRLAFRYVGTDGDNILIDAVEVSTRQVEADYIVPTGALYWGTACQGGLVIPQETVEVYPAYTPLTWARNCNQAGAQYRWSYMTDPSTLLESTQKHLTASLYPDFSSDAAAATSIYATPRLIGSLEGWIDGEYTGFGSLLQAGGMPLDTDGNRFGLLPFDPVHEGMMTLEFNSNEKPVTIGGHNANMDEYWTAYFLGVIPDADNHVEMSGLLNLIEAPASPLVVEGIWLNARGTLSGVGNQPIAATVYPINDDGNIDYTSIVATGECISSEDIIVEGDQLTIPIEFDSKGVLCSDDAPMYAVEITGLRNRMFTSVAPYMSRQRHKLGMTHGWMRFDVTEKGETEIEMIPLSYFTIQQYPCQNAFAINLNGYYPYLQIQDKAFKGDRATDLEIPFRSYYDASDLRATVTGGCSQNIEAVISGRFGHSVLTIKDHCNCESLHTFRVDITGTGVKASVTVSEDPSGIEGIQNAPGLEIQEVYTLQGVKVSRHEQLPQGVYIVKYSNGTTRKVKF